MGWNWASRGVRVLGGFGKGLFCFGVMKFLSKLVGWNLLAAVGVLFILFYNLRQCC